MTKIAYILLTLTLSISFVNPISRPSLASSDDLKWVRVNTPAEGKNGNWVLAKSSDVRLLAQAVDGTLYCYANPAGTTYTLFKSTDGGYTWSYTGKVEGAIADIATAPDNANTVYYATASRVYRSTDGGNAFSAIAVNPGGSGSNNVEITCLDVAASGTGNMVAIGTRDIDNQQYGGIYLMDEGDGFNIVNASPGNYDVYALAFSPQFVSDRQLIAVVTDETSTFVTFKFGNEPWDRTTGRATIAGMTPVSAAIVFPDDYSPELTGGQNTLFTAINSGSGNGDVFRIEGRRAPSASDVRDLNVGSSAGLNALDISGLAISGRADKTILLAGTAADAQVYSSSDGGASWMFSLKPPTGGSNTGVLFSRDFARNGRIYAFTSGAESAFSVSRDGGATWNQVGLIDTEITSILDVAVSPDYSHDSTLFLITFGGEHSLWRTNNGGALWERIYSSVPPYVDSFDKVLLSPQYADDHIVFISGAGNGSPAIWKSTDGGQKYVRLGTRDPVTGKTFTLNSWAIASDTTLFVGSYDGSKGAVYRSNNSGSFYSSKATAGAKPIFSIALSPGYEEDRTVLVSNTSGEVFLSVDNGANFYSLPPQAPSQPITGSIVVAFDPAYSRNKTVYAASNVTGSGIYRFIVQKSTDWESIDSTLSPGGKIVQLVTSGTGILYAMNSQKVNTTNKEGSMERSLNPTYPLGPKFETVIGGLKDNSTLNGLWLSDKRLWSIDTANTRLMTYVDSLTRPVLLSSPPDGAPGIGNRNTRIDWRAVDGADTYHWQLEYDTNFSSIPAGFEGDVTSSSARLPVLENDTTYYWRVRATAPILSPWSEIRSFTTGLGAELVTCKLISPEPAEKGVPIQPIFQWSALSGAQRYELMVSDQSSFASTVILKTGGYAIPATAWQCDIKLNPGTTYYWKIRAVNSDTSSPWSATGAFTTETPPKPVVTEPAPALSSAPVNQSLSPSQTKVNFKSVPETAPPTVTLFSPTVAIPQPQTQSQEATPEWVMWLVYMGGAFLLIMLMILVVVLLLAIKIIRD